VVMPQSIFSAIESGDLATLERILDGGVSPLVKNEKGEHPLSRIAALIKQCFNTEKFEEEDLYKKMAAMLIVHGAPADDLKHAFGEVSNLHRFVCQYAVDLAVSKRKPASVAALIRDRTLWFQNDDERLEADFMYAVEKGDKARVDAMFEKGLVHCAFEQ
ncbi:MAG: hypothetical protein P8Y65_11130, partial [Campylobacterales bacterium]